MDYPTRKRLRLVCYDYSQNGAYFVTICTQQRVCCFWNDEIGGLNEADTSVVKRLKELPVRFSGLHLDCYAVMPNHVHLLLVLSHQASSPLEEALQWLKGITTRDYMQGVRAGNYPPFPGRLWQRSYYDHVIRNQQDLDEARAYIRDNPVKWRMTHGTLDDELPSGRG